MDADRRMYREAIGCVEGDSVTMKPETIYWHAALDPPDADTTVLVYMPTADDPVDFGFWDGERWQCESLATGDQAEIMAWAHLPEGRKP